MGKNNMIYDEEKIIYLLKNKDTLKSTYAERELRLLKELESHAETVEGLSLKSRELKEFIISKTNVNTDPVFKIFESVEKDRASMVYEQIKGLKDVAVKKMELDILLDELDSLKEPYRSILNMLYVNCQSWKNIAHELDISIATCGRHRKKGIDILINRMGKEMTMRMNENE